MRARFTRDLRRLNDVLAKTPLAGHYAVTGGLLLGWARNRAILLDDVRDADFTYLIEDASLFDASVPSLMRAGFVPAVRFVNNDGLSVEHRFNYGDWRNANPDWHYTLAGTVIQRHTAVFGPSEWIPSGSRKR
jgi:hypothetical protein